MSNPMSRYFPPSNPALQKTTAQTVETSIEDAIHRLKNVVSDSYDSISVLSFYWESDDAGVHEDSSLFIQTISKLKNVQTHQHSLSDDDGVMELCLPVVQALPSGTRKLFILHYAGHSIAGSTPDSLVITPKFGQQVEEGPEIDMSFIKDELKAKCSMSSGLDALFVMGCSCAAFIGQAAKARGGRVEFIASSPRRGLGISRKDLDGRTFTQCWCETFIKLLDTERPFTCGDINRDINPNPKLEKPRSSVMQEGWDLPITFSRHPGTIESTFSPAVTARTVVTAINVEEDPNSPALVQLMDHLGNTPVSITVLATLPISGTLLLLRIPTLLEGLLVLPRVAFTLAVSEGG